MEPQRTENPYLKRKIEERTASASVLENLQRTAADAGRDLTEHERKSFDEIVNRLQFLDTEIKRIADAEAGAAKFVEIYGAHQEAASRSAAARDRERGRAAESRMGGEVEQRTATWGEQFVKSDQFKRFSGHGSSEPFHIGADGSKSWIEERAAITTQIVNGDLTPAMMWAGPTQPPLRTPLLDVVSRVPTTMGSVEYYYWYTPKDSNGNYKMASEVAEGAAKPEADIGGKLEAVPVSTYAWWKGITRQALDDIPMIQSIVDEQLRNGVIRRISAEAAAALDDNEDIDVVGANGDASLIGGIRRALAAIDDIGYSANAVLLNAADWADMDLWLLSRGIQGGGVTSANVFFGLRPVAIPGMAPGTAYVGDFREGITFFDRRAVSVMMTDSHADYFLSNKLVLLAEARGKVVVTNSAAIMKVEGETDTAGLSAPVSAGAASATSGGTTPSRSPRTRSSAQRTTTATTAQ